MSQRRAADESLNLAIRDMVDGDGETVLAIYREGIDGGNATFQTEAPTWAEWSSGHLTECRLIGTIGGAIAGWAALAPISSRPVYRGVVEVSIYVAAEFQGRGVGNALLGTLVARSEADGFWSLISGIFPENKSSIDLHRRHGFREMGRYVRKGKMTHGPYAGQWRDVVMMERRSAIVGTD